jgi:hypothetical protein
VQRQFIQDINVLERHRQHSQIIGKLLPPDHLIARGARLQAVELPRDLDRPGADEAQIQVLAGSSHAASAV